MDNVKAVWKFPLTQVPGGFDVAAVVKMPAGAEVVHLAVQDRRPCIWAVVDPNFDLEERTFQVVGTGHMEIGDSWKYVGTWQDDPFVWHLFETG